MLIRSFIILTFFSVLCASAQNVPLPASSVYFDINTKVIQRQSIDQVIVTEMVNRLILAVTGKTNPGDAWRSLAGPKDVIGIKVAAGGGEISGTHPEIVRAIAEGLIAAGLSKNRIIVWDRKKQDLIASGFSQNNENYQLHWVDDGDGYDRKMPISAPVLGKLIFGDNDFKNRASMRFSDLVAQKEQLSDESYFANTLKKVTKIINIPTLSDSYYTGVGGAIPNMTLSNLDNWRRFVRPPRFGDPYLAEIYSDPRIGGKVVLTILDAIVVQYAGGPFPDPHFATSAFSIYASKDPVAIDAIAMRTIDEYRLLHQLPKIEPISTYIQSAASIGLGNYDETRIEKIRVGTDYSQ